MHIGFGTKIILGVAAAVALATLAAVVTVQYLASGSRVQALRHEMSGLLAQSETMLENMDAMHQAAAFDQAHLVALAKEQLGGQSLREGYAKTELFRTIPVVAAWRAAAEAAQKNHYEFFTPSNPKIPARNPKNNVGANFVEAFKAFENGAQEYFFEDKQKGELVLARPIYYSTSCLDCHGSPEKSRTHDGLDVVGFPMENAGLGELKGAFVLKAKISNDPVVAATVKSMAVVGVFVLAVVVLGFWFFNARFLIKPVEGIITQLSTNSSRTAGAAREVSGSSQSLAEGASEQAASLEETSASLEEISAMTRRNAENAASSQSLSQAARASAAGGLEKIGEMGRTLTTVKGAVGEMESAVSEMQSSSQEIAKIIKTIDEIAFQTNLLALNAAVEAARAGEAGAGFAVVADEVRSLAQRSAQAAKDTSEKIEAAVRRSALGGAASKKVVESLGEIEGSARNIEAVFQGIVGQVKSLDEVIAEIATASKEQSQGIGEVNMAVGQMDKVTQSNAAHAEENASAAEEMNAQVAALREIVLQLNAVVAGKAADPAGSNNLSSPNHGAAAASPAPAPKIAKASRGIKPEAIPFPEGKDAMAGSFRDF